jgi:flavodoxin
MNILIIFDSNYGNTQKVAEAIVKGCGDNSQAINVKDFDEKLLSGVKLLVVGSPINGWRPTGHISNMIENLSNEALKNIHITSFDTRLDVFLHGDAKDKIIKSLTLKGGTVTDHSEAFVVQGREGPLKSGELERAEKWGAFLGQIYMP